MTESGRGRAVDDRQQSGEGIDQIYRVICWWCTICVGPALGVDWWVKCVEWMDVYRQYQIAADISINGQT
jgi:hypothetical protein